MDKPRARRVFLSSRCYLSKFQSTVGYLIEAMDESELQILRDSRVLSIFQAPSVPQNIPLLYMLVNAYDADKEIFVIGAKEIAFTPTDVALILGLPTHGGELEYNVKPYSRFTKTELKILLNSPPVEMKYIFLHLLCNFFFPDSGERIAQILVSLCEPEEFMKYNWPKAIHSFLMKNIKNISGKLTDNPSGHRPQESLGYVYGCTHALIIWFLEHTSSVSPSNPDSRPRLLRWSDKVTYNLKDLMHTMSLMTEEMVMDQMDDVTPDELLLLSDAYDQQPLPTKRKIHTPVPLRERKLSRSTPKSHSPLPIPSPERATMFHSPPPIPAPEHSTTKISFEEMLINLEQRMLSYFNVEFDKVHSRIDSLTTRFEEFVVNSQSSTSPSQAGPSLEVVLIKNSPYKHVATSIAKVDNSFQDDYPGNMLLSEEGRQFIYTYMSSIPTREFLAHELILAGAEEEQNGFTNISSGYTNSKVSVFSSSHGKSNVSCFTTNPTFKYFNSQMQKFFMDAAQCQKRGSWGEAQHRRAHLRRANSAARTRECGQRRGLRPRGETPGRPPGSP